MSANDMSHFTPTADAVRRKLENIRSEIETIGIMAAIIFTIDDQGQDSAVLHATQIYDRVKKQVEGENNQ